jgi:hypothetical protein
MSIFVCKFIFAHCPIKYLNWECSSVHIGALDINIELDVYQGHESKLKIDDIEIENQSPVIICKIWKMSKSSWWWFS